MPMFPIQRNWKLTGGLLLAAATLKFPCQAQELPPPAPPAPSVYDSAPLAGSGLSTPRTLDNGPITYVTDGEGYECPPYDAGPIRRWKMRHKAKAQDKMCGYPEEFHRPPLGAALKGQLEAQKLNGRVARLALYEYDFVPGTDELKPRGRAQLAKIGQWIPTTPGNVMIEPSIDGPDLDEARRTRVWQALAGGPFALSMENIRIGRPVSGGLDYGTATAIGATRLQQSLSRGVSSSGGAGGAAGGAGAGAGGGTGGSSSGISLPGQQN